MNSPNKPKSKASRLARMTEKPIWRKKTSPRNKSITANEVGNQPTPPNTYSPNYTPNPQGHSFEPLYKPYNISQTSNFIPSHTSQPPSNYNDPYHFGQSSNYTSNNFTSNYRTPIHPPPPNDSLHITTEKQKFRE